MNSRNQIISKMGMRGFLTVRVLDALSRRTLRRLDIPNQVCVGAKDALQRLCTQTDPTDVDECLLFSLWAGTDGTAPTPADTSLICAVGAQFRKVYDVAFPIIDVGGVTGLLEVQMTMEAAEGNGAPNPVYREVGLFSQGPPATPIGLQTPGIGVGNARMYARQVHAMIEKTAAIAIQYNWRFQFVTL